MDFTRSLGLMWHGHRAFLQCRRVRPFPHSPIPPFPQNKARRRRHKSSAEYKMTQDSTTPRAAITTPHYLASEAGRRVLDRGGNALEAIVAAGAVLAVVYPQMCTLGGDAFYLIHNAATGELTGINASGKSGEKASRALYRDKKLSAIPSRGALAAITVPGIVSGWDLALAYSSSAMEGKLSLASLLEDARRYAEEGFPITPSLANWIVEDTQTDNTGRHNLQRFAGFAKIFLPDGAPLKPMDILRQPDLARTLEILASAGSRAFYEGEIARALVRGLAREGGILTEKDLASQKAFFVQPLQTPYREYTACNLPPNCQGLSSLQILGMLNCFDAQALGEGTAAFYHVLTEAVKRAFADRERYVTDPDFSKVDYAALLAPDYLASMARELPMDGVGSYLLPSLSPKGDTVWLGCVDAQGNAVSYIQSIYHDFGSGIVPEGTGILLQNRGSFFSLDERHANTLEPCKRTMHTLNPPMLLKDGKPYLVYGTMGGDGQPQTQAVIASRIVDFGMSAEDAVAAPRFLYGRTWGDESGSLKLEGRIRADVGARLAELGHSVEYVENFSQSMGHAGAILVHGDGSVEAATDPRSDGLAISL